MMASRGILQLNVDSHYNGSMTFPIFIRCWICQRGGTGKACRKTWTESGKSNTWGFWWITYLGQLYQFSNLNIWSSNWPVSARFPFLKCEELIIWKCFCTSFQWLKTWKTAFIVWLSLPDRLTKNKKRDDSWNKETHYNFSTVIYVLNHFETVSFSLSVNVFILCSMPPPLKKFLCSLMKWV
jgi:hypothetical protein